MKILRVISSVLAMLVLFSTMAFASESADMKSTVNESLVQEDSTTESTTEKVSNSDLMLEKLRVVMAKNGLNNSNFAFSYIDFGRDLKCYYNAKMLFNSNEALKFPLAYLYFDKISQNKMKFADRVGGDTLKNTFIKSLTNDDATATDALISYYGGINKVKTDMLKYSSQTMEKEYYSGDKLTARYCADFLTYYYNAAIYCSTDFKTYLIDPIKSISPNEYSEAKITDCKVTHRYGFSSSENQAVDMGIVNSSNPFALVIYVQGVDDPENVVGEIAKFAYDYNYNYSSLLISEQTTLPTVAEKDKKEYKDAVYSKPLLYGIIGVCTVSVIVFAIIYIRKKHIRKMEYRGEI